MQIVRKNNKILYECDCGEKGEATLLCNSGTRRIQAMIACPCLKCNKQLYVKVTNDDCIIASGFLAEQLISLWR